MNRLSTSPAVAIIKPTQIKQDSLFTNVDQRSDLGTRLAASTVSSAAKVISDPQEIILRLGKMLTDVAGAVKTGENA